MATLCIVRVSFPKSVLALKSIKHARWSLKKTLSYGRIPVLITAGNKGAETRI